ncbi:FtsW/RodA/SpoVE family cell cycle protein [Candidatus Kaiserbacteria bacterium]|nr:FtsW/RodA/SpoVE family cell cycle protein [Candidatus Kaiserbacteria bacterium]
MSRTLDRTLLGLVILLVVGGFFIFSSASLGLLAREGARFSSVAFNQIFYGIVGGSIALLVASSIQYRFWRRYAFYIFVTTGILTLLVFVPKIGLELNGAHRWVRIGFVSFQPSEFLKIGYVIYLATWLSGMKQHIRSFRKGTLPFFSIVALVGAVVLAQPDTDTFVIMTLAGVALFLTAGGRWRDVLWLALFGIALVAVLAFSRPYIMDRLTSFIDPSVDPQGKSYQINQSLIAIGSGHILGRGFGQSIQKFEHLPEPISDSIFAVYSEEFGFIGGVVLILLFSFFAFRGYRIAAESTDLFGMLLVVGFVTLIVSQAFLNIAAMLALAPLSGLPLPFISQGGTALLAVLASVGIILNVSKHRKKRSGVVQ